MRLRRHRGIALITALWIMAALVILLGGFAALTYSEIQVASNFGESAQTAWAARAGVRRAEKVLLDQLGADTGSSALVFTGGAASETITSTDDDTSLGQATYQVVIDDEAGKININTADLETLNAFFSEDVAASIINWRTAAGAAGGDVTDDDAYYASLSPAYNCKHAPFETVRELHQVRGVTEDLLAAQATADGRTLEDVLTTCSTDTNVAADGQARVNLTSATQEQLSSRFGNVLTSEEIDAIIARRSSTPYRTVAELLTVPNLAAAKVGQIYDQLTVSTEGAFKGLVNLNTAPTEVLQAVGFDENAATAVINYRTNTGTLSNVGALLSVPGISPEIFMQVTDRCTTRSKRFRVVSTGTMPDGATHTTTAILQVETSGETTETRTLYWREE